MKEPREELQADAAERRNAPDFDALTPPEDVVRGGTRDVFFDTILTLDRPTTVEEVAERAEHGVDAAREYLVWFERLGVVTRVTESPATYERNEAYLQWRRIQHLQGEYSQDELLELLQAATDRDESYAIEFDVDAPADALDYGVRTGTRPTGGRRLGGRLSLDDDAAADHAPRTRAHRRG